MEMQQLLVDSIELLWRWISQSSTVATLGDSTICFNWRITYITFISAVILDLRKVFLVFSSNDRGQLLCQWTCPCVLSCSWPMVLLKSLLPNGAPCVASNVRKSRGMNLVNMTGLNMSMAAPEIIAKNPETKFILERLGRLCFDPWCCNGWRGADLKQQPELGTCATVCDSKFLQACCITPGWIRHTTWWTTMWTVLVPLPLVLFFLGGYGMDR